METRRTEKERKEKMKEPKITEINAIPVEGGFYILPCPECLYGKHCFVAKTEMKYFPSADIASCECYKNEVQYVTDRALEMGLIK